MIPVALLSNLCFYRIALLYLIISRRALHTSSSHSTQHNCPEHQFDYSISRFSRVRRLVSSSSVHYCPTPMPPTFSLYFFVSPYLTPTVHMRLFLICLPHDPLMKTHEHH